MAELSGRKALARGAGVGIGQGIAVELGRRGAAVAVHYPPAEPNADETVQLIKQLGADPVTVQGDLTVNSERSRVVERAAADPDGLDIFVNNFVNNLINNAGITGTRGPAHSPSSSRPWG